VRVAFVGRDEEEARASLRREADRWGVAVEELAGALIGTPEECVRALKPFVDLGVSTSPHSLSISLWQGGGGPSADG
jgi:alkanesulfonate monooxygenase SsuD/methylene tetrahydromethanopterin reductase-like flavin-dependent oxidoreductase (luciferase family)